MRQWQWGELDCCLFLADWIVARDGIDPASDLRGSYATQREMRHLLKARGGIRQVVGDCAARAGLVPTYQPQLGDVGLVNVCIKIWRGRGVLVPCGGIMTSRDLWAIKVPDRSSVMIQRFPVVCAWGSSG